MPTLVLWGVTIALFLAGVAGIFVPALPGVGLVFVGALFYAIATNFTTISPLAVGVFFILAVLAWLTDYLGAAFGARLGGGRLFTLGGLLVGGLLGVFIGGPAGLVLGALSGAAIGALYEGKTVAEAGRAALFSFLGVIGARALQLLLAIGMIVGFFVMVLV